MTVERHVQQPRPHLGRLDVLAVRDRGPVAVGPRHLQGRRRCDGAVGQHQLQHLVGVPEGDIEDRLKRCRLVTAAQLGIDRREHVVLRQVLVAPQQERHVRGQAVLGVRDQLLEHRAWQELHEVHRALFPEVHAGGVVVVCDDDARCRVDAGRDSGVERARFPVAGLLLRMARSLERRVRAPGKAALPRRALRASHPVCIATRRFLYNKFSRSCDTSNIHQAGAGLREGANGIILTRQAMAMVLSRCKRMNGNHERISLAHSHVHSLGNNAWSRREAIAREKTMFFAT